MKDLNLTLNVDTIVCQDITTAVARTKLSYCQLEVMGCSEAGIFFIYDEETRYYSTEYVYDYLTECSSGELDFRIAWFITLVGVCAMMHCTCMYYFLSHPECLKSKNKFTLLCSPI